MKNNKNTFLKPLFIGIIVGSIAPIIGLFVGLQVSPTLGSILTFPFLLTGALIDQTIGEMSDLWKSISFFISMIVWGVIFVFFSKLLKILKK